MDFLLVKNPVFTGKKSDLFLPLLDFLAVKIDLSATDDRLTPAFKEALNILFESQCHEHLY
jgi:hypothetical protein